MRTISIRGTGKAKRDPDMVVFRLETSTKEKEYEKSIEKSNKLVNKLKTKFEELGFTRTDLKTTDYRTRPVYDYVEVGVVSKRHKQVLEYYETDHNLKVEFELDNEIINEVLKILKDFSDVRFNIDFTVKDKEGMKKDVIVDATRNARFNAEILAEASSVELGNLIKIEYNWEEFSFISRSRIDYDMEYMMMEADYSPVDFTPDTVEITDTVSFVWEIK